MWSPNKKRPTAEQGRYLAWLRLQPCSVCGEGGGDGAPSEIHEMRQGQWWLAVPLCASCHRGPHLGLSGLRHAWKLRKMDEVDALGVVVRALARLTH